MRGLRDELWRNATTTPVRRASMQSSPRSVARIAVELGVTEDPIRRWKGRERVEDRSHTAHRLQTTLTPAQEAVVVHLRRTRWLSLDDVVVVTREFLCERVSRSGLDRCVRRHGVGHVHALTPATPKEPHKIFKRDEPGYVPMDITYRPQMADEICRRSLFVAIDRATRWVYVAITHDKTAASARSFLQALHTACPVHIVKLLTDNGKEFTDRLCASRARQPSGEHEFDRLCQELGIAHRLTKPRTPQPNGMVERVNGRIAQVLATRRYRSAEDLGTTLLRYAWLYNQHLPQKAMGHRCPMEAMKQWYTEKPDLFAKQPRNLPGPDS